ARPAGAEGPGAEGRGRRAGESQGLQEGTLHRSPPPAGRAGPPAAALHLQRKGREGLHGRQGSPGAGRQMAGTSRRILRMTGSLARALALSATLLAAGCYDTSVAPDRQPRFVASTAPAPRVALVLGSGGPRGFAHIGVLKALDEAGIKPDLIVGS